MATSRPKVRFTYSDYCLLPDDKRYELIDGDLYMAPAPLIRHQVILRTLLSLLWPFVRDNGLGQVYSSPVDVIFSNEDVFQPDLLFVAAGREGIVTERACEGPPDLVIEILSPSTGQRDRELKRKVYANYGVKEYWLVDPENDSVQVLRLAEVDFADCGIFRSGSSLTTPLLPGLELLVSEVFTA
jgi:Uma2 family endonuclease